MEQESYGTMLTSVLLTKLPPEVRLIVTRKAPGDDLDLASLQTALEEELIAREHSRDPTRNNRHHQDKPRPRPTATALFSETQEPAGGPASCCYCQQSHTSSECHIVKDLDARWQILMTNGRCFNCLAKGHVSRRCRSPPPARGSTTRAFATRMLLIQGTLRA